MNPTIAPADVPSFAEVLTSGTKSQGDSLALSLLSDFANALEVKE